MKQVLIYEQEFEVYDFGFVISVFTKSYINLLGLPQ